MGAGEPDPRARSTTMLHRLKAFYLDCKQNVGQLDTFSVTQLLTMLENEENDHVQVVRCLEPSLPDITLRPASTSHDDNETPSIENTMKRYLNRSTIKKSTKTLLVPFPG